MSYNFKNLTQVDMIDGNTENINLIVESNDSLKRVPVSSIVVNTNNLDVVFISSEFETGEYDDHRNWSVANPEDFEKVMEIVENHGYIRAGYWSLESDWDDGRGDYVYNPTFHYLNWVSNTTEMSGYKRLNFENEIIWSEYGVSRYENYYGE